MSSSNVSPIKAASPLPHALILYEDQQFMIDNVLHSWAGDTVITAPADIAELERVNLPRRRYKLIPDDPAPTPPGKEQLEVELDEAAA